MSVEPTEIEELRGPVLGIIDAYGMGDSVDPPEAALEDRPRQLLHVRRGRSRTTSAFGRAAPLR